MDENKKPVQDIVDEFDLKNLRISQDYLSENGVKKLLTSIHLRKPSKEWFVRTHPDENYRITTKVLRLREDGEMYVVAPSLWPELADEKTIVPYTLITSINRQGNLFLWAVRLPNGRKDQWAFSELEAAARASKSWVKVQADSGFYAIYEAKNQQVEPVWPELSFQEIMDIALKDSKIATRDHPVLKALRGE